VVQSFGGVGWVSEAFGLENQLVCVRLCFGAQVLAGGLDWIGVESSGWSHCHRLMTLFRLGLTSELD